jgi:hypothetical protein
LIPSKSAEEQIKLLEEKFLKPDVRKSREELTALLSDDFVEFGSSGRIYNKQQVLDILQKEKSPDFSLSDFNAVSLTPDLVLVTYTSIAVFEKEGRSSHALRSSIWKFGGGGWQIIFHQGTPLKEK